MDTPIGRFGAMGSTPWAVRLGIPWDEALRTRYELLVKPHWEHFMATKNSTAESADICPPEVDKSAFHYTTSLSFRPIPTLEYWEMVSALVPEAMQASMEWQRRPIIALFYPIISPYKKSHQCQVPGEKHPICVSETTIHQLKITMIPPWTHHKITVHIHTSTIKWW